MALHDMLILGALGAVLLGAGISALLQAGTIANLTKVHADQKTMAVALEAYNVDQGDYPPFFLLGDLGGGGQPIELLPLENRLVHLSTPVAYLSPVLLDEPFNSRQGWFLYEGWDVINQNSGPPDPETRRTIHLYLGFDPALLSNPIIVSFLVQLFSSFGPGLTEQDIEYLVNQRWFLASPGPDGFYSFDRCMFPDYTNPVSDCIFSQLADVAFGQFGGRYDPTNGLISNGEIVRTRQTPPPTPAPLNAVRVWARYD